MPDSVHQLDANFLCHLLLNLQCAVGLFPGIDVDESDENESTVKLQKLVTKAALINFFFVALTCVKLLFAM